MKKEKDKDTLVWLIEDNTRFSAGVERVLNSIEGMACSGRFTSAEAAFDGLNNHPAPDVILLDVQLPGMNGIAALDTLCKRLPDTRVIILTVFDDSEKIFKAVCAGASGYILKDSRISQIGDAIRQVMNGGAPMTPEVAKKVLNAFARIRPSSSPCEDYHLTPRENEILRLLADGLLKKEIADALDLSVSTVSAHLQRVYTKLHVNTNTGAVAKALREGII